jgi:hypothetical protein
MLFVIGWQLDYRFKALDQKEKLVSSYVLGNAAVELL